MSDKFRIGEASKRLNVSNQSTRNYVRDGLLKSDLTPAGHRVFTQEYLDEFLGNKPERVEALYCRVSSNTGQETSLATQEEALRETSTGIIHKVYKDRGSGLSEQRRGLKQLIGDAKQGKITVIRILYKDRLTRFGYTYLTELFDAYGVTIEVLVDTMPKSLQEELMSDFMSLIASFSGKFYKLRGLESKTKLLAQATERLHDE